MADSSHKTFGYARRGILVILALLIVGAVVFGAYQWNVYHRNLAVNDANLPPLPVLTQSDRLLILSPHPDDETLGAGGLMTKAARMGVPVRVVFLTNGDGSLATRLVQDAQFVEQMAKGKDPKRRRNIYQQIAPMRQKEALSALAKLNVPQKSVTFLGYPDGGTKRMWETNWNTDNPFRSPFTKTDHSPYANSWTPNAPYSGQQVLKDVEQIIVGFKPTIVVTTNPYDTHPDHWAAYSYLLAAVAQLQLQQKYFSWAEKIRCYTFIVHHGFWPAPHGYHPNAELSPPADLMEVDTSWFQLPLDENDVSAKTAALQQYKSQLSTTPQFLRGFLRRNELFAQSEELKQDGSSWKKVIHDPPNDLLMPQLISAADITAVSVKDDAGKVLLMRIDLDGKPWKDVAYEITLHVVTEGDVLLRRIRVSANNKNQWQGTVISGSQSRHADSRVMQVDAGKMQLIIQIPATMLAPKADSVNICLISVASVLRDRTLDQTPTAVIQLAPR